MATPMRQAIARHMTYSKQHIPHYYLTMHAEVSAVLDQREEWNANHGDDARVSVNDLVVKATAIALQQHPQFNAYFQESEVRQQPRINIGVAISLADGLVAPAILDCGQASIAEIGRKSRELAVRSRGGTLRAEEYSAATFTITNLGMYHVESFTAIIVPPQVGILAVGAIQSVPALREGDLITERRMALTLSGDHRASDGAEGARFLGEIISCLQNPASLFA